MGSGNYDIGNRVEYAKCFLDFALRRDDTREALQEHPRQQLGEDEQGYKELFSGSSRDSSA